MHCQLLLSPFKVLRPKNSYSNHLRYSSKERATLIGLDIGSKNGSYAYFTHEKHGIYFDRNYYVCNDFW